MGGVDDIRRALKAIADELDEIVMEDYAIVYGEEEPPPARVVVRIDQFFYDTETGGVGSVAKGDISVPESPQANRIERIASLVTDPWRH